MLASPVLVLDGEGQHWRRGQFWSRRAFASVAHNCRPRLITRYFRITALACVVDVDEVDEDFAQL